MRLSRILAALALPLALTACSQQPASTAPPSAAARTATASDSAAASSAASASASESSASSPSESAATDAGASASPAALPVIGSRKFGKGIVVDLNTVTVHDGVTTVNFTVSNTDPDHDFQVTTTFSDGIYQKTAAGKDVPDDAYTVDGVYLVDTAKAQRYLPGRGADGQCACSRTPASMFIRKGASNTFSAVFKGLPAETQKIAVFIPQAGMFDNVPVTR